MKSRQRTPLSLLLATALVPTALMMMALTLMTGCAHMTSSPGKITKAPFGVMPDGKAVDLYILTNGHGVQAKIA
ncbi:MAG: hypothetical protein M1457_05645, partial [bacterium]|nr:hypothetical protein [bacterium]